ncbi:hypothetical protein GCM10011609_03380 [Lentzea pudingi]|uniref:Uncharacterized protein n=1 Tax=Lentzea pudingi TaxID=1789439 RepID=A0ABQ2H9Y3_9PSEU|nr:hypothetical protein [Lentzea pudingi]GGM70981.1 hypothetical protein GCM10011609_03380 [Lentzea pudingi]
MRTWDGARNAERGGGFAGRDWGSQGAARDCRAGLESAGHGSGSPSGLPDEPEGPLAGPDF